MERKAGNSPFPGKLRSSTRLELRCPHTGGHTGPLSHSSEVTRLGSRREELAWEVLTGVAMPRHLRERDGVAHGLRARDLRVGCHALPPPLRTINITAGGADMATVPSDTCLRRM